MDKLSAIQAVETRAFGARRTMSEVCKVAGITPQTWSRAKTRRAISVAVLRKVEAALSAIESGALDHTLT